MFVSKKNAQFLNKPSKGKKIEVRVLPGWDDNEENEGKNQYKTTYKTESKNNGSLKNVETNLLGERQQFPLGNQSGNQKHNKQSSSKKTLYNWDELNELNNIQCEKRLVQSIVEPVGVKVKPPENLLAEFVKQAKSMDPVIVGSLLLSKLEVNYPFLVKAKSLHTIEHLVKKSPAFTNYFKQKTELIQGFPEPQDNVENYRKILKNLLSVIGVTTQKTTQIQQNQAISFVDPGYNDHKQQSQIKGFLSNNQKTKKPVGPASKKFISPNEAKKTAQTTGADKKNDIFDIFAQNSQTPSTGKSNGSGFDDLISLGEAPNKNNNIKFDDLLK